FKNILFDSPNTIFFLYINKHNISSSNNIYVIKLTSIQKKIKISSYLIANQGNRMSFFAIVFALICAGRVVAQSSNDCTNVLISMSPCLNYITGNSSVPSSGCCTQLDTVVKNNPSCLCQVLNGGASNLGLNINQTQAMALPTACKVQTPPLSQCNADSPNGSPAGAPTSPTTDTSGRGPNAVPSPQDGSNDATSTKMATPLFFFLLFVASTFTAA
ncbi:non-specific lipid transfer protein GPI-anchored 5-like, partial [Solanum dulcamara]|uniref:non-specific lipid transfer protein GPI-anchored 5-like n=1 Tax=Solanum dulcamara TaxID=45834 RepID=UPI0024865B86